MEQSSLHMSFLSIPPFDKDASVTLGGKQWYYQIRYKIIRSRSNLFLFALVSRARSTLLLVKSQVLSLTLQHRACNLTPSPNVVTNGELNDYLDSLSHALFILSHTGGTPGYHYINQRLHAIHVR